VLALVAVYSVKQVLDSSHTLISTWMLSSNLATFSWNNLHSSGSLNSPSSYVFPLHFLAAVDINPYFRPCT
jgi:hypothetical protein